MPTWTRLYDGGMPLDRVQTHAGHDLTALSTEMFLHFVDRVTLTFDLLTDIKSIARNHDGLFL